MNVYFAEYEEELSILNMKPCPFCGSKKALCINNRAFYDELLEEHGKACLTIKCKTCDLELTEYSYSKTDTRYAVMKEDLINKWNNRKENAK